MPPEKIRTVRLVIRPTSICKKVRFVMQRHLTDANNRPPPIAPVLPEFPVPSLSSLSLSCFMPSYERDLKGSLCECFKSYAPRQIFEGHNYFFFLNSAFPSYFLIRVPSFFFSFKFFVGVPGYPWYSCFLFFVRRTKMLSSGMLS